LVLPGGWIARSPDQVKQITQKANHGLIADVELLLPPMVSDEDVVQVCAAGFRVYRPTYRELESLDNAWTELLARYYAEVLVAGNAKGHRQEP
jgi:hypothetical protein